VNDTYDMKGLLARRDADLLTSKSVEVSPGLFIQVDRGMWEMAKDSFASFCNSLPVEAGPSYKLLKHYVGGNGDMAKLLIALGEEVGVWKMHPPVNRPELWGKSTLYPMVAAGTVRAKAPQVPKPSAGDLERDTKECSCCARTMGPENSKWHDLHEGPTRSGMCYDCDYAGCDTHEPCRLEEAPLSKRASAKAAESEEEDEELPEDSIAAYMRTFGE
jgi:hypothetical protein